MTIHERPLTHSLAAIKEAAKPQSDAFRAELERQLIQTIKTQAPTQEAQDPQVTAFKEQLTSMGAVAFFQHQNMEKIEKLLEEKRKELEKIVDVENLGPKEQSSAFAEIEKILEQYARELQERFKAKKEPQEQQGPLSFLLNS